MAIQAIRARVWIALVAATALLGGCSGSEPMGKVTGTLLLEGQPLPAGHGVVFMEPTSGNLSYSMTDGQGKFSLKEPLPVGQYEVSVRPIDPEVAMQEVSAEELIDNPGAARQAEFEFDFPKHYGEPSTSGLKYDVKEGDNDFTIDMKKDAAPGAAP
jgi:hypothetical protein